MNVLILGAGAVGGYFGGRLVESGAHVTFLVREQRKKQLQENGLIIRSVHGDYSTPVPTISSGDQADPFDLVILTSKAYHLDQAITDITPYVGYETILVPLLNGYAHIDRLQQHFGKKQIIGGLCFIESTLNEQGEIIQTSQRHDIVFGELNGEITPRVKKIESLLDKAHFHSKLSETIVKEMWNKYLFITALSGMTTLFQSSIGPILESPYGREMYHQLLKELSQIVDSHAIKLGEDVVEKNLASAAAMGYQMKSSMLRDMEKGLLVEADHLQGEFLKLATSYRLNTPLLKTAYNNLKVYEINL